MTTLTSTGNVNLTSSTNWSPAQTPVAGDDLIINGAHNLTLDADMTLNSITFANNSARLVMPAGTTRVVQATNGFIVTASITLAVSTTLVAGMDLTLRGAWSATGNNSISNIAASTGGDLTLEPAGGGTSGVIFADTTNGGGRGICSTWSGGTLTTRGLMNFVTASGGLGNLVNISGGTWNHTHTGSLTWGGTSSVLIASVSGTASVNWSGDLTVNSLNATAIFLLSSSGTHTFSGTIKRTGSNSSSHAYNSNLSPVIVLTSTGTITITGAVCVAKVSRAVSIVAAGAAGSRLNWRSQSISIAATDAVIIMNGNATVFDATSLVVTNAGIFTYVESGGASAVVDSTTSITNTTTSAQASVTSASGALDGKIVNLASSPPTLPTVDQVAAGTSYGYSGTPLTGTGLIMDPATLATAMITSFSSLPEVMVRTTIATLASQTSFTLTAGSADDDVYNGLTAVITDQSTSVQKAVATISDYVGASKTVTLSSAPGFTVATGDLITVIAGGSSGGGGLDAAGVRSAIGLASANLDTQLGSIAGYIDTEVAAIKAKTDNLPADPADASDIAASFSTVNSTLATIAGYIDTEVAAIKAKTDNLPSDPADQSLVEAAITSATSGLASQASVDTLASYVDTEVAAIKAKTDNLPADPADQSAVEAAITAATSVLATAASLATVASELAKVHKQGETRRFTQVARDALNKTADVTMGAPL